MTAESPPGRDPVDSAELACPSCGHPWAVHGQCGCTYADAQWPEDCWCEITQPATPPRDSYAAGVAAGRRQCGEELVLHAHRLTAALIAIRHHLDQPYLDDPRWTPWSRWVEPELETLRALGALAAEWAGQEEET